MRFRAHSLLLLAVFLFLLAACARSPRIPTAPDSSTIQSAPDLSNTIIQPGHNLLGYWNIHIDSEQGTYEAVPLRASELHLNVLTWLEYGPCTDCLQITDFEKLPNKDLRIEISLTHPYTQPNLSGFDVRGIAMFQGNQDFPEFNLIASCEIEGDTELINADGYTTLYNPGTAGNNLQGYLKGKIAPPFTTGYATLNGYKTYFTDSNRNYFLAGDTLPAEFLIRPPVSGLGVFGYAIDASWDIPTLPATVPDSFPITANSLEAYLVEASLANQLATTPGATATLIIDVYDWQGESTLGAVQVEGPYFWDGIIDAVADSGGPGTKRFTCELVNEFGFVPPGDWPVLIRVLDSSSQPGALVDNIAWKLFNVAVIINHTPECSMDISNPDPDPGEEITFTDTSTDLEGPGDLAESWWDWDNNGDWDEEGFAVNHSWTDPGIYFINHKVIDMAGAEDELDEAQAIDVGLFITLAEDFDMKIIDTGYRYQSLDHSYDSGGIIDVNDPDGPWDFTTIGLNVGSNWMRILDDSDPEVAGFKDDFNSNTNHFVKFEDMFDPFFPMLYQAEYHHFASDKLFIYGFHDPFVIGSSPFGPPDTPESLAIPYPLAIDTDYSFDINEPGFVLNVSAKSIGQGEVTVPYDGGTTYDCLLVRYRFSVSAAEPVKGGTLNFAFIADNGLIVANVIAVNDPPIYNWNTSSNTINSSGDALFQALHQIEN